MKLNDAQRQQVSQWINDGLKLSQIQTRLDQEIGVKLTYMEVRFLVDDLKLVPKDPEPPKNTSPILDSKAAPLNAKPLPPEESLPPLPPEIPGGGAVTVTVDHLARPGALVSGKVKFSDGQTADWSLDQMGRLGLAPQTKGYKPTPADIEQFQMALQKELSKMGF